MATGPFAANVKYLGDGNQEIAEYDGGSGALLRRYVYGPGIDEPVATIDAGGARTYHHQDGLGSVIALSNGTGAATASFTHGPYGETTNAAGTAYRYTGRRIDPETGLYYYRARYYSPNLGRFMQTDPIGYQGGINLYAYVGNSPVNLGDPLGLQASPQGGSSASSWLVAMGSGQDAWLQAETVSPHSALALGSFCPSVCGSAFSGTLGVLQLLEGDNIGASISLGAAALGTIGDAGAIRLAANYTRGVAYESDALQAFGLVKDTEFVFNAAGKSAIPDSITAAAYWEVKSGVYVYNSTQLRIMVEAAQMNGLPLNLILPPLSRVSQQAQNAIRNIGGQIFRH